jgi:hypothetical protein
VLVSFDHVASIIVNPNPSIVRTAVRHRGADCIIRRVIPKPTEWQRIGDQIDAAMILAGPDFIFVREDANSMVDEIHPRQPFLRINVLCWREVFRMIETSNSDVDLIGATLGFVGEGSAARIAESSKRACVSFISMRFPSFPFEVGALRDGPRDRLGAGRATAVFAMAIRGDARLPVYREANLSAVTSASDHDHFEKIDMNQEPASYPANGDVNRGRESIG